MTTTKFDITTDNGEAWEKLANTLKAGNYTKHLNVNEKRVYNAALECIGGVENSIADGVWEDEMPKFADLFKMAYDEAMHETPKECRFLGMPAILTLCAIAATEFEIWW